LIWREKRERERKRERENKREREIERESKRGKEGESDRERERDFLQCNVLTSPGILLSESYFDTGMCNTRA